MWPKRSNPLLWSFVVLLLVWAGVEARHLRWQADAGLRRTRPVASDLGQVERDYASLRQALEGNSPEQAVLALRERTRQGPHPAYAWFLLGELAYEEAAYPAAVQHYRRAVEVNPVLADRGSVLHTAETMDRRLQALLTGPWRKDRPRAVRDLYALLRRLGGGCE